MRISSCFFATFVANASFVIVYSGFFFYQTLVAIGYVPPILGAYWGMMNFIVFFPLFFMFVFSLNGQFPLNNGDKFFLIFISYFICILLVNGALGKNSTIILSHVSSVFQLLTAFFIFRMINIHSTTFKNVNFMFWLIMTAIIFFYSVNGSFNFQRNSDVGDDASIGTYQAFGFVYLITSILLHTFIKSLFLRYIFHITTLVALFLNGSRSDLIAYALSIFILEFVTLSFNRKVIVIFLITISSTFILETTKEIAPDSRILLLFSTEKDTSVSERGKLFEQGLVTLNKNPFLGDFASYSPGNYIHNGLSAWVDMGLIGFLIYVGTIGFSYLWAAYYVFYLKDHNKLLLLSLSYLSISVLLTFFAKNFTYTLVPVGLGIFSNYLNRCQVNKNDDGMNLYIKTTKRSKI